MMADMNSRQALALMLGVLSALLTVAFAALLILGLAPIHDAGTDVNVLAPALDESVDVNCGSALRPRELDVAFTESDCGSLTSGRAAWVKPGLWVSGGALALLGMATVVAATDSGGTVSRYPARAR